MPFIMVQIKSKLLKFPTFPLCKISRARTLFKSFIGGFLKSLFLYINDKKIIIVRLLVISLNRLLVNSIFIRSLPEKNYIACIQKTILIYVFFIKNLKFSSTALVIAFFYVKYCPLLLLAQY